MFDLSYTKGTSMSKLDELEKALKKYQELLKSAQMGGMTQPNEATMKAEKQNDDKEDKKLINEKLNEYKKEDKKEDKKEEKEDEKKDEKLIEEKLKEHDKKKSGELVKKSIEVINFNNNSQWSLDE